MADSTTSYTVELSHVLQDLKEKFKHGEHITRILEGQLETAQQNISLLQGQVRLANETIDNLKQQFKSSENAVFFLLENGDRLTKDLSVKVNVSTANEARNDYSECNSREEMASSPKSVIILQKDGSHEYLMSSSASSSIQPSNPEKPKSPYAQQLRQVLDILQNEEPARKKHNSSNNYCQSNDDYQPHCHCPDCNSTPSHRHTPTSSGYMCKSLSCTCAYHSGSASQASERERTKVISPWASSPKLTNGLDSSHSNGDIRITSSQKGGHIQHHNGRSSPIRPSSGHSQCGCSGGSESASKYNMNERSHSQTCYYTSQCNEGGNNLHRSESNGSGCKLPCNSDECSDTCCNSYNSYSAPYGYQMLDSQSNVGHSIHPPLESAGRKRKRSLPMLQLDDPPHLKYTKVKRIDGSKLTAQKTIADFSKRRYLPCNPRYDLDLLIVPPPLAASELLNRDNKSIHLMQQSLKDSPQIIIASSESKLDKPTDASSEGSIVSVLSNESSTIDQINIQTESRSPEGSVTSDDNRLIVVENNNVHSIEHEQTNHTKSSVCDITTSKIPHFMNPLPPSLPTKS